MKDAEPTARTRNTAAEGGKPGRGCPAGHRQENGARTLLMSSAPRPKPMMTIPVASPLRSGKPFCHCCNRRHVSQPKTDPPEQTVAQVQEEERFEAEGQRAQRVSEGEKEAAGHGHHARPDLLEARSAPRRGDTEKENCKREDPCHLAVRPPEVSLVLPHEEVLEEAPGVHGAEAQHENCAHGGNQPARSALFIGGHDFLPVTEIS